MADSSDVVILDGKSEPSPEELISAIEDRRARWQALVERASETPTEPGVAADWSLRDVVAHINAYLRFHVANLGGRARPLGEMPEAIGFDTEKRNTWMHEQDRELSWSFVRAEGERLHEELLGQLRARSPEEFRTQLVDWQPWPTWRWMCDIRDHYDQHEPGLRLWLDDTKE